MPDNLRARTALSQRLRKARLDAGLTGQELTAKLGPGWGQPKVSKLETGRQLPSDDDIELWASVTGAHPNEFKALLKRARHEYASYRSRFSDEGGPAATQDALAVAEQAATTIASYQPLVIPGFLQTPDYARALLSLPGGPADSGASEDEIARMVAARMRRAAILYEPGRTITLLIGEAALHNRFAPAEVMRAQLEHIARLAETLTTTTIGIIPFDQPQPVAIFTGWDKTDDLIEIETPLGALDISDPDEVARYDGHLQLLVRGAVTGHAAAIACRAVVAELT